MAAADLVVMSMAFSSEVMVARVQRVSLHASGIRVLAAVEVTGEMAVTVAPESLYSHTSHRTSPL
jgi:hypothetical protein